MYFATIPVVDNIILQFVNKNSNRYGKPGSGKRKRYNYLNAFIFLIIFLTFIPMAAVIIRDHMNENTTDENKDIYEKLFIALMVMFSFAILKIGNLFLKNYKFDIFCNLVIMGCYGYILYHMIENGDKLDNLEPFSKIWFGIFNAMFYIMQIGMSMYYTTGGKRAVSEALKFLITGDVNESNV